MRVGIIGAGPSGLALARLLADRGYDVYVYEAHKSYAVKPCGWGFPVLDGDEASYSVFREALESAIWEYSGYDVYLDDALVYHSRSNIVGYIIDKREFLSRLSHNVKVLLGYPARYVGDGVISSKGAKERFDMVVIAGGYISQPRRLDRIIALQAIVRAPSIEEPEIPELRFYSELVGYSWIFPKDEKTAGVGVGGYASRQELEGILRRVIRSRRDLSRGSIERFEGAEVTVSGIDWDIAGSRDPYYVGEALGYVMPATGEGIRPGIWSSIALYRSIENKTQYQEELRRLRLTRSMGIQKKVLDLMLKMKPGERGEFLRSIPEDLMLKISLGRVENQDLLRIARIPGIIKILARYSLKIPI